MKRVEIYSRVTGGKLEKQAELNEALKAHEGKDVRITLERKRKRRSLNQNAYYFGVVLPAVCELLTDYGNDVDIEETHYFLKAEVGKLTKTIVNQTGVARKVVKSSAKLSTVEMEDYLERVRRWAAGHGVIIPLPEEGYEVR